MTLLESTKRTIKRVHDSSAKHLLASDEAARRLTTRTVSDAADRVSQAPIAQATTRAEAKRIVARQVRRVQDELERDFTAAMAEARSIAREMAARQVAIEAEPVLRGANALTFTHALPEAELESLFAEHAGRAVAQKLGSTAISETAQWERKGESLGSLSRRLGRVGERLEPERKRHALTQAAAAYSEAKRDSWAKLKEGGALPPIPGIVSGGAGGRRGRKGDDGVRRIWSAILDRKTCPHCWKLDGEMAKLYEPFPEDARTPLHGHCRCDELTVFIPEELRRYMSGAELDYQALKDDIREYMGSRSFDVGEGVRHAKSFVDEVLESRGRSPVILTARMNDRRAYFPNIVQARAPSLSW